MVNWLYTLWEREYEGGRKIFLSKATRGGVGIPIAGDLDALADYYDEHREVPHTEDLTFDASDSITTIPAVIRRNSQYTDRPATEADILRFEDKLCTKFQR